MHYDVVVIGAGIQGAGVAQAATAAGYSVLVLEQQAIAAGTSSKSSKLIHGGLRYLESAQFGLVRESLRERALLLKLAPDLVKLQPLHIPIYQDSKRSPLTIRAGLSLYSVLAGLSNTAHFRSLPQQEWDSLTGLKQDGLREVFRYYEAQTDDAALTAAVLRSAQSLGAEVLIPARFVAARVQDKHCEIDYEFQGQQQTITANVLMNCSGPWALDVLARITPAHHLPAVELVQGSHLLLPPLLDQYFYLEAPQDKRAIFVLPWKQQLLIGTTETIHHGAPEAARCLDSEKAYLLHTLKHYFPALALSGVPVTGFAGLRVLPRSEKSAFFRPREVLLDVDNAEYPRVLSLMGGKLTTYRPTAQMALDRVRAALPERQARADTAQLPLYPE
jgi:glycerol-3-phosphate dehydrogenase